MINFRSVIFPTLLFFMAAFPTRLALGQDAVKTGPGIYTVAFENERVRVLEVRLKPGEKVGMHEHPDCLTYIVSPGKLKFTYADKNTPPMISEAKIGEIIFRKAEKHTVENMGLGRRPR
jgi:quercetin dioxygenase-like cupin family protein